MSDVEGHAITGRFDPGATAVITCECGWSKAERVIDGAVDSLSKLAEAGAEHIRFVLEQRRP